MSEAPTPTKVWSTRQHRYVWVGYGAPRDPAGGDFECPEVTHRYVTREALKAALASGEAFK